ncbi:MAG: hypothetical protein ACE5IJ_07955 [Thermoplasmata archaeon]
MKIFRKRQDTEEIEGELRATGAAIDKSKASGADSSSAMKLLEKARVSLEAGRPEEARTFISKAEKLGKLLEKRYVGARKNIAQLFKRIEKMKELGMNTYEFEALLVKARKRMEETVEENGVSVPNYGGAGGIAGKAAKIALKKMREHESASNATFVANMILENTLKSMVYVDEGTLKKVSAEVVELLKRAEEGIKSGDLREAYELSVDAERRVETLKRSYREACDAYKTAEKSLVETREKGIRSSELAKLLEAAGQALIDGNFEAARLKSIEVSSEIKSLESRKRRAKDTVEKAENAVEAARETGFDVSESENLLEEAKWAYERGIFQRAINCGEEALKKGTKVSSIHFKVTESLQEAKKKVDVLKELGIEISNELEEVIQKAEKDLLLGDYVNSNEELMIAKVLIGSLERKHHDMLPEIERHLESA